MRLVMFIERDLGSPDSRRSCQGPFLLEQVLGDAIRRYAAAAADPKSFRVVAAPAGASGGDPTGWAAGQATSVSAAVTAVELHGDRRRVLALAAALGSRGLAVSTPTVDLTVAEQIDWFRSRTGTGTPDS